MHGAASPSRDLLVRGLVHPFTQSAGCHGRVDRFSPHHRRCRPNIGVRRLSTKSLLIGIRTPQQPLCKACVMTCDFYTRRFLHHAPCLTRRERDSSITMDRAKELEMDSRLLFKNPEVEGRGILLRLRFKRENTEVKRN